MNVFSRGIRNAFRNSVRTFSIVVILGLSIGLALAMLVARASVQEKIRSVKSSIGNTVNISPAGAQGFMGGGEPLTNVQLDKLNNLPNINGVTRSLSDRLTTENTNLVSAIEPGTLGNRGARNSGVGFEAPPPDSTRTGRSGSNQQITRTFTPPVMITGINNTSGTEAFSGSKPTFISGQNIDASKDADVAVVGKSLADKNSLKDGSTFTAYGKTITVNGIYDTGNTFANAGLVMSLSALQRLSDQAGSVTSAIVTVNSVDNIDVVVTGIKSALGTSADVVSNQDSAKQAIAPLESVKTTSLFSLIGAVIAGAIIILLTMVMIVRERRREIGVFKAIGASNLKVMTQFISEAVTLTIMGMVAGIVIGVVAANPVTKVLVNNSTSSSSQTAQQTTNNSPMNRGGMRTRIRGFGDNTVTNVRNIQASVGWEVLGYGAITAFVIAVIGSAIPAILISKIRPAEVMRAE